MHLDLTSSGKNGVGISLTASNAHVDIQNGTAYMVFDFHADVWGTVLEWHPEAISVQHGCKLKILGVTIVSVCGYIEKKVRDQAQKLLNTVSKVDAPRLIQKLEDKINTVIGSQVRIPLRIQSTEITV